MATQKRILVVEDEEAMIAGLDYALKKAGYEVAIARDGQAASNALDRAAFDLVLLDVMLPKRSGFDVLAKLRRDGRKTPVILLTAKNQEMDKVRGFDLGADDYVTKPFSLAELEARIRARLRVATQEVDEGPHAIELGPARIDLRAMKVELEGRTEDLSVREVDMLRLLWSERGRPVSRERFLEVVWGHERFPTTRTVDQHVVKLRQKIERDASDPRFLVTAFGVGYRLNV